jgi:alpha-D-ribose 1-methylphosphonate 5-triphosphate diphosphatase PhnM
MDTMIDFTNQAPRESLMEFFHSIHIFVSLSDANLASAIEKCQQFYNVDSALFSDFMPESNRSQILTRLRAQRLSKFSASNRHQTPYVTEERKADEKRVPDPLVEKKCCSEDNPDIIAPRNREPEDDVI